MTQTIFYSWQSDTPSETNRNLIEEALERAIHLAFADLNVEEAQRDSQFTVDRDTKDVPGIPEIVNTIFDKIEKCAIFVPDLTFISKSKKGRLVSNPNVLIEYGWALSKVGRPRIIPVMNNSFGEMHGEALPFDMRHLRRPISYSLAPDATPEEKTNAQSQLAEALAIEIRNVVASGTLRGSPKGPSFEPMRPKSRISSFLSEGDILCRQLDRRWGDQPPKSIIWHDGPQLFLRLIPSEPLPPRTSAQLLKIIDAARLEPFGRVMGSWNTGNKYGAVTFEARSGGDQDTASIITQISERGEIWAIDGYSMVQRKVIPYFEPLYAQALQRYIGFMRDNLGLKSPIKIIAGMSGVDGFPIQRPAPPEGKMWIDNGPLGSSVKDDIMWEGTLEDFQISTWKVLLPFFEMVWGTCQIERFDHLRRE
jgi:hypothetical protein